MQPSADSPSPARWSLVLRRANNRRMVALMGAQMLVTTVVILSLGWNNRHPVEGVLGAMLLAAFLNVLLVLPLIPLADAQTPNFMNRAVHVLEHDGAGLMLLDANRALLGRQVDGTLLVRRWNVAAGKRMMGGLVLQHRAGQLGLRRDPDLSPWGGLPMEPQGASIRLPAATFDALLALAR